MRLASLLFLLPLAALATGVDRGDTYLEVRATLGEPRGELRIGDWRRLIYDRGEIELESDRVTKVALRTPEAQAELDARRTAEAEIRLAEMSAREARLAEEGAALKARKLADQNFLNAPAAYQLAFWQDFARLYPGVLVTEEIAIARLRVAEQEETRRAREVESRRIAELEERVRAAEERAERAEAAAGRYSYYAFPGYSRGRHRQPSFLPEYHWNNNVQPPYTTPSGSPAGRMDGAPYTTPSGNPAGRMDGAPYVTPSASPLLQSHQPNRREADDRRDSHRGPRRG